MKQLLAIGLIASIAYEATAWEKVPPKQPACPSNSSYESYSQQCVCWNGFKLENNTCVPVCPEGYELDYKMQQRCVKKCHEWNTYYDEKKDACVKCPENSLWEPSWQECRCYGGFEKVHDYCLPACPAATYRHGYDCIPQCPEHSTYESAWKKCVCDAGFRLNSYNQCQPDCKKNEVFDHKSYKCVCAKGFVRDHYDVCIPECGKNEVFDYPSWKCTCNKGFVRDSSNVCIPECGKNELFDYTSYKCVCKKGFIRDGYGTCIPECGKNEVFSYEKYQCVCAKGFERDDKHPGCFPICDHYSTYDHKLYKCVCDEGYEEVYGKCEKKKVGCPSNSSFEAWSGECVCWNGFKLENNKCVPVCPEGYELDYKMQQRCVKKCYEWNTYYDEKHDACVKCPENSLWEPSWNECRCTGGFEWVHEKCLPVCNNGWKRDGYNCKKW